MESKMYILTEGGHKVGYGHITRCSALYEELEKREYDVTFVINGDDEVSSVLGDKKFILKDWRDKNYLSNLLYEKDCVIIDSYLANEDIYEYIAYRVKKALYIDDNMRINYPKGIVCNPSIYGKELKYPFKEDMKYLLGIDYVILRKEFINIPEKKFKDKIEDILITFGGSDITNITPKILKELRKNYSQVNKHVIIGKGFINLEEIKNISDEKTFFYYNLDAEEMKNLMLKCDFAISAAGQTIYELLRVGIPFIPIQVADNQENNIKGLEKIGIINQDIDEISKLLVPQDVIIDGKGVERIIDFFLSSFFIREVRDMDKKNIFDLSNEDYVRKYSLNQEKIIWENHLKWFEKQKNNENILFFIVENLEKYFLGQIKFEINENKEEATVSISFKDTIKGQGLGKVLLGDAIKKIKSKNEKIKYIRAIINNDNIPSYKLFKSLDFILDIKGMEFSEYIKKI